MDSKIKQRPPTSVTPAPLSMEEELALARKINKRAQAYASSVAAELKNREHQNPDKK